MKSLFLKPVLTGFILLFTLLLLSCGSNAKTIATGGSANSIAKSDTAMPPEPVPAAVDSVTPDTRNTGKDSVASKVTVQRDKVKVVDTTKKNK